MAYIWIVEDNEMNRDILGKACEEGLKLNSH